MWYPSIAPEFVKNQLPILDSTYELVKGNMKYANHAFQHVCRLVEAAESLGDMNWQMVSPATAEDQMRYRGVGGSKISNSSSNTVLGQRGFLILGDYPAMANVDEELAAVEKKYNRKLFFAPLPFSSRDI